MTRPLSVRPLDAYDLPDYPGVPVCRDFSRRRYAPTVLDAIKNGLSRPLVVFGLFTCLSLPACGDEKKTDEPGAQGEAEPKEIEKRGPAQIQMLSRAEVESLIDDLDRVCEDMRWAMRGVVIGDVAERPFFSEEEARAVLRAFFKKNGFDIHEDMRLRDRGYEFEVDGFDPGRQIGYDYLSPSMPETAEYCEPEVGLNFAERGEVELGNVRGGRAILLLDGRRYECGDELRTFPATKAQIVDRLLEDVRSFLAWLFEQGRLAPTSPRGKEEKE